MKVMLVSFLLDPHLGGGAATSAVRQALGLARQGVEVVGVTTHEEAGLQVRDENGIKTYSFRPRNLYWVENKDRQPLWKRVAWQSIDTWNLSTYQTMRRLIQQERPDVIHIHKLRGLSPSIWNAAAAEGCRPIVQTCRDYELISPEGLLQSTIGRMAARRHWAIRPYQAIRARASNLVDVATSPSRFTLETITRLGFFGRARQVVVPNTHGLSAAELDALPAGPASDPAGLRLLYLGRLESEKGIDVLCRAFAGITAELPQVYLDVAGGGGREAELRAAYADLPRLRFHGHVSGAAKDGVIAQCDVLVMPSIVNEVFGNSIIEAYAYGKPVIAARIGGMPEVVDEGETGLLVEAGQVESLQQAIRLMLAHPEKRSQMSQACREKARCYTLEAVTAAYLAAYAEGLKLYGREALVEAATRQAQAVG
jgi:glycosyltransferase involved in cell wall biosynthesis